MHRGNVLRKVGNVSASSKAFQTSLQQADSVSFGIWKLAAGSGIPYPLVGFAVTSPLLPTEALRLSLTHGRPDAVAFGVEEPPDLREVAVALGDVLDGG